MQAARAVGADALGSFIGRLWAARDMHEVANVIRNGARHLVGADGITLVLREADMCHYVDEDAVGALWKGRKFPMSACISGWAMMHRRQVAIADIFRDARIPHDAYRPTFVKSLVMTPVRIREPVAALGAYWRERREATEAELGSLQALADAAANAITHRQQAASAARRPRVLVAALPSTGAWIRDALAAQADVGFAESLESAMSAFRAQRPDLVIVGYHFDHARPYRMIQAVREDSAAVPILLVRALPLDLRDARDAQIRESYAELGASQYLVLDEHAVGRGDSANRLVLGAAVKALFAGADA